MGKVEDRVTECKVTARETRLGAGGEREGLKVEVLLEVGRILEALEVGLEFVVNVDDFRPQWLRETLAGAGLLPIGPQEVLHRPAGPRGRYEVGDDSSSAHCKA